MNHSIHAPGRGSSRARPGTALTAAIGAASPQPSATNTDNAAGTGAISANPSAAPMNGAVHGVATIVASTPVAKAPMSPPCPA